VFVFTRAYCATNLFLAADSNGVVLGIITEVVVSLMFSRAVVRINLTFSTAFLSFEISSGVTILGVEVGTLVLILPRTNSPRDLFFSADSNGVILGIITEVVVGFVFSRTIVRVDFTFSTTFLFLKISGRMAILCLKICTLMLVLTGTRCSKYLFFATNTNGLSSYTITEVVVSFMCSRSIVRIHLTFSTTFLFLKVSGRVTVLGLVISSLMLILSRTSCS